MYSYDIVIIDTGVEIQHNIFKKHKMDGFGIENIHGKLCLTEQYQDEIGHGTAVAGIIVSKCPDADICIIKIFGNDFTISLEKLIFALNYVENNIECKVINLSLGINYYSSELECICESLRSKGCIIVAALDNDGTISCPAMFDSVIGVDSSDKCKRPDQVIVVPNMIVDVFAYGNNYRVAWLNNSYIFARGNSFATADVTAKLYNGYIKKHKLISVENAQKYLIKCSFEKKHNFIRIPENKKHTYENEMNLNQITNAAVFPYNKEIHSLVNFANMLTFKITHIYDVKQLGKVGTKVKGLVSGQEFLIKNIENINWSDIDTLILGHLDKISSLGIGNIKLQLLKKCLKYHVNVYAFDNADAQKFVIPFAQKGLWLKYPTIDTEKEKNKNGKLYTILSPVLGIFGTSSNQGKFTLQLQLREYFNKESYSVGQIGTEPSSLLFGMDKVFAYGYASCIQYEGKKIIEHINEILYEIDKEGKDIIIIGGQSGTIPVFSYNLKYYNLNTLNVFMGANPDGVILCVNIFDSISYLKRCINIITSLVDCTIIAIAISPLTIRNDWQRINGTRVVAGRDEIEKFRSMLRKEFSLDSYVIGTEEIRELFCKCIDFYTQDNENIVEG